VQGRSGVFGAQACLQRGLGELPLREALIALFHVPFGRSQSFLIQQQPALAHQQRTYRADRVQLCWDSGEGVRERIPQMGMKSRFLSSCFLASALAASVAGVACAEHHSYRVYDPYYSDYHVWNNAEIVYYNQWARDNHRDEKTEFRKLPPEEQKEYWTWRHSHGDRDNDRDKGQH
jgi:hypothetical protein